MKFAVLAAIVLLIILAVALPHFLRTRLYCEEDGWFWTGRRDGCASSALATLRSLNFAEVVFVSTYNSGFTDGWHRLGPPKSGPADASHADIVDEVMAGLGPGGTDTSFVKYFYRFTYRPGPGAFGSIKSYTISARPLKYGDPGTRSFYTDQTGAVRSTTEDREATAQDPTI